MIKVQFFLIVLHLDIKIYIIILKQESFRFFKNLFNERNFGKSTLATELKVSKAKVSVS